MAQQVSRPFANAQLIATAPELLAACEGAVELIEAWRNGIIKRAGITWQSLDDAPPALKALHAVVAKAKGVAP